MEEEDVLKEAFFAPSDGEAVTLQALFEAFSKAAELNPEPGDEGAGADEEGEELGGGGGGGLVFDHGRCVCVTAAFLRLSLGTRSLWWMTTQARLRCSGRTAGTTGGGGGGWERA